MLEFWTSSPRIRRAFLASLVACLSLLYALAFVLSPAELMARGAAGSIAGDICRTAPDEGGDQPASPHPSRCHHCTLCTIGGQSAFDGMAVFASVLFLLAPRSDATPVWFLRENQAVWPSGDGSAWFSGVPPPIS